MKHLIKTIDPRPFLAILIRPMRLTRPLEPSHQGKNVPVLKCRISYNKFGGYCIPLSSRHRPTSQKILSGGVWEPDTIDLMRQHSAEGDIVHAGTYFGDFIPALSKSCGDGAKVWAFEPNPENYRCAQVTIYINALQNVELRNMGLGAKRGVLPMMTHDETGKSRGGSSRIVTENSDTKKGRFVEAEIVSLDAVVPSYRKVAIIQLDVEGFEKPALEGAMKTIKRCKPILILETLPKKEWLKENIYSLGYRKKGQVHLNTIFTVSS